MGFIITSSSSSLYYCLYIYRFFGIRWTCSKIIREFFGWKSAEEYWFPNIRSMEGAIFVMSFVLYPYIYMLTRASFITLPISFFQTSAILWKSSFFQCSLTTSKACDSSRFSFVLMETISDFGTVEYFALRH